MNPPPPIPQEKGSVTPSTAAAATAASTAFPPASRTSIPACEASRSTVAMAPPVPTAVGCFVSWATLGAAPRGAANARARVNGRVLRKQRIMTLLLLERSGFGDDGLLLCSCPSLAGAGRGAEPARQVAAGHEGHHLPDPLLRLGQGT